MQTDVKVEFIRDSIPGSNNYIVTSQTPTAGGSTLPLVNTEFSNGSSRQIILTTTAPQTSTDATITITGIDITGQEVEITRSPTAAAGVVTILNPLNKIISIVTAGTWNTPISVGMLNVVFKSMGGRGGRVRLRGYSICPLTTTNAISFFSGPSLIAVNESVLSFKAQTSPNVSLDYPIPEDGIIYENGMYVSYNVGDIISMNAFYD